MPRGPIVVNPWHWLAEDGSFLDDPRMRSGALRVAQCIEYGGPLARGETRATLIACRFRPQRRPCQGLLWVLKQSDDAILAFCAACRAEEFLIYEWEDTVWADGPMDPLHVDDLAKEVGQDRPPVREVGPEDAPQLLVRALEILGSPMPASEVVARIAVASQPTEVLQAVIHGLPTPPTQGAVERFVPVLVDIWNQTPRPELSGRSPEQVRRDSPVRCIPVGPKVSRNAPCPCGSGRKYKRCCGAEPVLH